MWDSGLLCMLHGVGPVAAAGGTHAFGFRVPWFPPRVAGIAVRMQSRLAAHLQRERPSQPHRASVSLPAHGRPEGGWEAQLSLLGASRPQGRESPPGFNGRRGLAIPLPGLEFNIKVPVLGARLLTATHH